MLTKEDIEFMKATRREIIANRTSKILVKFEGEPERDPISGEPIGGGVEEREVDAIVTEISSRSSVRADRDIVGGIVVQEGDLWLSIEIGQVADIADDLIRVVYRDREFEVLAVDRKGIGEFNRVELLARLIS